MTTLKSFSTFDQTAIDFYHAYSAATDFKFADNYDFTHGSVTFHDLYGVKWINGSDPWFSGFGGETLTVDAGNHLSGGIVNGYFESSLTTDNIGYGFWNCAVDAATFWSAFTSASNLDDIALINSTLDGNDTLVLSSFSDRASGQNGNDTIKGQGGNDTLDGNAGADRIFGGTGRDQITGGMGRDFLTGNGGADVFRFKAAAEISNAATTTDVIADFVPGADKIDVAAIDASTVDSGGNAFVWRGTGAFTSSSAGEVRYHVFDNAGTTNDYTMIYFDRDGDTQSEFMLRLTGLHSLSASDFVL